MKKFAKLLFAALSTAITFQSPAFAVDPVKGKTMVAKTTKKTGDVPSEKSMAWQVITEAMWTAGGEKYRDAVIALSYSYKEKMDKNCKVKAFDVSMATKNYRGVYVPAGAEAALDKLVLAQVGTMACIMNPYLRENEAAAAIQKLWKV